MHAVEEFSYVLYLLKKNVAKSLASCGSIVDSGNGFFVLASYFCDFFVKFFDLCIVCVD